MREKAKHGPKSKIKQCTSVHKLTVLILPFRIAHTHVQAIAYSGQITGKDLAITTARYTRVINILMYQDFRNICNSYSEKVRPRTPSRREIFSVGRETQHYECN